MNDVNERYKALLSRYKNDFPAFAANHLKIRSKSEAVIPLVLNKAQLHVHRLLEDQKKRTGKVRALVLKGRQQGISTYLEGREYHLVTFNRGIRASIMTHKQDATDNLFGYLHRFYDHTPTLLRPTKGKSNEKEMSFPGLDSSIVVETAGSKESGRSTTIQILHGSEVAFWPNALTHQAGILQAVPDAPNTEVIYETTANGYDPLFQPLWQDAVAGSSEWIAIFVPWFWQDEYRSEVPADFVPTDDEAKLQQLHGLDNEQLAFRRKKVGELKSESLFKQEYPCTAEEAFQLSGFESFIPQELVLEASKRNNEPASKILMIGVDPAESETGDETAIAKREGAHFHKTNTYRGRDTMQVAGIVAGIIDENRNIYDKIVVCIDVVGIGAGVYARLKEMGYGSFIHAIRGGSSADNKKIYYDKRAETADRFKEWLEEGGDLPDDPKVIQQVVALGFDFDSQHRLRLESKKVAKKRGVSSPDIFDAKCLTFAVTVHLPKPQTRQPVASGTWMG